MKTEKKISLVMCGIFLGISAIYKAEKREKEKKLEEERRKQDLINRGRECLHNNFYYQEVCTEVVKGS